MFALVYASRETQTFDPPGLLALAALAGERNAALQVTGYLSHRNGVFFQYLEGDEAAVRALMDKIAADARHEVVNVVTLGEVGPRKFRDWRMRYLTAREMRGVELEDVLQNVLLTVTAQSFAEEQAREMVGRMTDRLAAARNRLGLAVS